MIKTMPKLCRGGPWLLKTPLQSDWLQEVNKVASMTSFMAMHSLSLQNPQGNLYKHLQGLNFTKSSEAKPEMPVHRGASVTKKRRSGSPGTVSGKPGNDSRKSQLRRGVLKRPSADLTRLHRGQDAQECRRRENAKRVRS